MDTYRITGRGPDAAVECVIERLSYGWEKVPVASEPLATGQPVVLQDGQWRGARV